MQKRLLRPNKKIGSFLVRPLQLYFLDYRQNLKIHIPRAVLQAQGSLAGLTDVETVFVIFVSE
jgi:hypothetical protein